MALKDVDLIIMDLMNEHLTSMLIVSKEYDKEMRDNDTYKSETAIILSYGSLLILAADCKEMLSETIENLKEIMSRFYYTDKQLRPADEEMIKYCQWILPNIKETDVAEEDEDMKLMIIEYIELLIEMVEKMTATSIEMFTSCVAEKMMAKKMPEFIKDIDDKVAEVTGGKFTNLKDAIEHLTGGKVEFMRSELMPEPVPGGKFDKLMKKLKDPAMKSADKKKLVQTTMIECYESHPEKCKTCNGKDFCEQIRRGDIPDIPMLN